MNRFYSSILIFILCLAPLDKSLARGSDGGWLFGFDLSYLSFKSESVASGVTSETESNATYYDATLGYMISSNVMAGAILATKNTTDKGATLSTSTSGSATGASLSYIFDSGVYITGNYFLTATDQEYKKGSGIGVDLGWRSFLSGSLFIGAKLSYRSLKYTENQTISGFESQTNTTTLPYISLGFSF